ncbi:androglobin-like isoform X13, partial [Brachionus plicatilis]
MKNSWPLSPSQWSFVNTLKESEAADLKVFSKDRAPSPSKENKTVNSESKGAVLKAAKAKAQKSKTNVSGQLSSMSRPASSAFDITKPHWTLKWVSDASSSDNIEIKKDTDRIEEIKALKKAWESHEMGRSVKAMASRHRFLRENLVKADGGAVTDEELDKLNEDQENQGQNSANKNDKAKKSDEKAQRGKKNTKIEIKIENLPPSDGEHAVNDEVLTNTPPAPPKPKIVLPPIDIDPFIRDSYYELKVKDDNFEKEQAQMRKIEFDKFSSFKEQMNKFREEERKYRFQQKIKQIEECEVLQSKLDAARMEIMEPREAFRQIFLEAERKRLEEMANQEAVLASQQKVDTKKKGSA